MPISILLEGVREWNHNRNAAPVDHEPWFVSVRRHIAASEPRGVGFDSAKVPPICFLVVIAVEIQQSANLRGHISDALGALLHQRVKGASPFHNRVY